MITVNGPGGVSVDFPEGTDPAVIDKVMRANFKVGTEEKAGASKSFGEKLKNFAHNISENPPPSVQGLKDIATLPQRAYQGKADVTTDEGITQNMPSVLGMAGLGVRLSRMGGGMQSALPPSDLPQAAAATAKATGTSPQFDAVAALRHPYLEAASDFLPGWAKAGLKMARMANPEAEAPAAARPSPTGPQVQGGFGPQPWGPETPAPMPYKPPSSGPWGDFPQQAPTGPSVTPPGTPPADLQALLAQLAARSKAQASAPINAGPPAPQPMLPPPGPINAGPPAPQPMLPPPPNGPASAYPPPGPNGPIGMPASSPPQLQPPGAFPISMGMAPRPLALPAPAAAPAPAPLAPTRPPPLSPVAAQRTITKANGKVTTTPNDDGLDIPGFLQRNKPTPATASPNTEGKTFSYIDELGQDRAVDLKAGHSAADMNTADAAAHVASNLSSKYDVNSENLAHTLTVKETMAKELAKVLPGDISQQALKDHLWSTGTREWPTAITQLQEYAPNKATQIGKIMSKPFRTFTSRKTPTPIPR